MASPQVVLNTVPKASSSTPSEQAIKLQAAIDAERGKYAISAIMDNSNGKHTEKKTKILDIMYSNIYSDKDRGDYINLLEKNRSRKTA